MVIIKEDNTPCLQWSIGRIVKVYYGADNLIRVVDVKTAAGIVNRPIHRLAPLLAENDGVHSLKRVEDTEDNTIPRKKQKTQSLSSLTLTLFVIMLLIVLQLLK